MKKFLALAAFFVLFIPALLGGAITLEEVSNNTFVRGSGSPIEETITVDLQSQGELRISNGDLVDGDVELAASTDVLLNGVKVLDPFHLQPGTSYIVFLEAGTHSVSTTLRGKPGGAVNIRVLEEVSISYDIRFELLEDGTVKDNKTGLAWHRTANSPGWFDIHGYQELHSDIECPECPNTANGYIADLNAGIYGADPNTGNAGKSDWRVPTVGELNSLLDQRFSDPAIANKYDEGTVQSPPYYGHRGGMQFGDPFNLCPIPSGNDPWPPCWWDSEGNWNERYNIPQVVITNSPYNAYDEGPPRGWSIVLPDGEVSWKISLSGSVWPVRGPE